MAFVRGVSDRRGEDGKPFDPTRFYCGDGELIRRDGRTYAFSAEWGVRTAEAARNLLTAFPDRGITCRPSE